MTNGNPKMLVFCSTKIMVDDLYDGFSKEGMKIGAIHGDMPQLRREKTIRGFKNNRMKILVATDVAARGLDIDDIECVVNYDAPIDPETYTHRIGRAGRAGRTGVSITFISNREDRRIPAYEEFMGRKVERVTRKQIPHLRIDNPELKALHADEVVKEQPAVSHKKKIDATIRKDVVIKADMVVLSLDIGKNEGLNRTDIVSYISGSAGIKEDEIGRIGLSTKTSFIEVPSDRADDVIRAVNGTRFNGKKVKASYAPQKERCKDKLAKKN
jgi:ATP-dependent RNA helicase DeaD